MTDSREQDGDMEVPVSMAERNPMSARGPKSSGDSEEVEMSQIDSPDTNTIHPSLQEASTSSLIQPVNLLGLHDNRQFRTPDRPREITRSNIINHSFSPEGSVLNGQTRSMISDYTPQYNQQTSASEIHSYIDTQSANEAPSLYVPRSAPHSFTVSSPDDMGLREREHYATLHQHQQAPLAYSGWPTPPYHPQNFTSPVNYADTPTSTHASHQGHSQPVYQLPLPPPGNSAGPLPPLVTHQSDMPFGRISSQYEMRTGSQGHPQPHHGLPHPDFSGFSIEDKGYGERS